MWASGAPETPEFPLFYDVEYDSLNISLVYDGWNDWPSDGTIYRFNYFYTPIVNDVEVVAADFELNAFPNPTNTSFTIYTERLLQAREHAELKVEQIHAFGKDFLNPRCEGSMSATIEAEPSDWFAITNQRFPEQDYFSKVLNGASPSLFPIWSVPPNLLKSRYFALQKYRNSVQWEIQMNLIQ